MGKARLIARLVLALMPWVGMASALDTEAIVGQNEGASVVIWGRNPATGAEVQGSGCCVNTAGYVLTAAHQVIGLEAFRARLRDGSQRELTVVDVDVPREVALLKSAAPMPQAVRIGDASTLRSGSALVAIAAPVGLEFSAVTGIVSSPNRTRKGHPMIQSDIPASPGSSGGPVFDRQGKLVGLIVNRLEQEEWIKMITPINNAYPMLRAHGIAIPSDRDPAAEAEIIPAKNVTYDEWQAVQAYNEGVMADSPAEKIIFYQRAVSQLPEFFEAWFNLGVAYSATEDLTQAVHAYLKAGKLKPDFVEVPRNLGRIFLEQQRLENAVASFQQALELAPSDPPSYNDLGYAYLQLNQLEKAEECFVTALELEPEYPLARYNLALTYAATGRLAWAIEQFERYLNLAPDADDAAEVRAIIGKLKSQ